MAVSNDRFMPSRNLSGRSLTKIVLSELAGFEVREKPLSGLRKMCLVTT